MGIFEGDLFRGDGSLCEIRVHECVNLKAILKWIITVHILIINS